jgi:hypothetical protein
MQSLSRRRILGAFRHAAFLLVCSESGLQLFHRVTAGDWLFERAALPLWAPDPWSGIFNKPNMAYRRSIHESEASNYTNAQALRVPEGHPNGSDLRRHARG